MPAQDPEQLIFERREDGYYDVTSKIHAIDPEDNTKTTIVYAQCVAKLPDWIYGIPLEAIKQEKGELYSIVLPEE